LVLGILSFAVCGPCAGIPAFIIGLTELTRIKRGAAPPEGKPFALAGAILGGINSALLIFGILLYLAIALFIIIVGFREGRY
jgi:hypothetical protein